MTERAARRSSGKVRLRVMPAERKRGLLLVSVIWAMAWRSDLLGMVPRWVEPPPTCLKRSTTATDLPSLAACMAAPSPPGPLPMTIRSNSESIWLSSSISDETRHCPRSTTFLIEIFADGLTPRRRDQGSNRSFLQILAQEVDRPVHERGVKAVGRCAELWQRLLFIVNQVAWLGPWNRVVRLDDADRVGGT